MNGTAVSQVYTLDDIVSRVINRLDVSNPARNYKPKIVKEINASQRVLAEKAISESEEVKSLYYVPGTGFLLSDAGEISYSEIEATLPVVKEVIDVIGSNYGTVPYLEPAIFKNASNSSLYDNGIFYTTEARVLKTYAGTGINVTSMTFEVLYLREVNTLADPDDFMDLPASKFDELVNSVAEIFAPSKVPQVE